MATLQDLPNEILCVIADHLGKWITPGGRASLARANKHLNDLITPILYGTVAFGSRSQTSEDFTVSELSFAKFPDFAATVFRQPRLARLVHSLHIENNFCKPASSHGDLRIEGELCRQWMAWKGKHEYFETRIAALFTSNRRDQSRLFELLRSHIAAYAVLLLLLTAMPSLHTLYVEVELLQFWSLFKAITKVEVSQPNKILQRLETVSFCSEFDFLLLVVYGETSSITSAEDLITYVHQS